MPATGHHHHVYGSRHPYHHDKHYPACNYGDDLAGQVPRGHNESGRVAAIIPCAPAPLRRCAAALAPSPPSPPQSSAVR